MNLNFKILAITIFTFNYSYSQPSTTSKKVSDLNPLYLDSANAIVEKNPKQALTIINKVLDSPQVTKHSPSYIQAIYLKAQANKYLENHTIALKDYEECLKYPYFTKDTAKLADLKFNIARSYDCLSEVFNAMRYYSEALNLYQKTADLDGQAKVLQNMGIMESDLKRDSLAMLYYLKALDLYKITGNKLNQAAIYQNIGVIYLNQEKYPQTIDHYKKALRVFTALKDHDGIGTVENNLGMVFEQTGNYKEALFHYKKALYHFQEINSREGLAYLYDNLASLYKRMKNYDISILYYKKSLAYADTINIYDFLAYENKQLAALYETIGLYADALKFYKTAIAIEDSIESKEAIKKFANAEATFQDELKDVELQKKELQIKTQIREKIILLVGVIALVGMLFWLVTALRKKILAERLLKKHQESLEKEVIQRTQELRTETLERQAAEEADKLKTAFLANMSHEIRTPMNAILAFSNFLKEPELTLFQRTEYINYINSCSKSLLHLIDDILDTAKLEAKQLKISISEYYINSILNELFVYYSNHKKVVQKEVELVLNPECVSKNFILLTDGIRLRQIFNNLLDNAFKFTEKGTIEYGFRLMEHNLEFYVKDSGIGIPKEKMNMVFQRFGLIHDNNHKLYKGTGLGLSISKNLVELLGGNMWFETEEGKGSAFIFTLPNESLKITEILQSNIQQSKSQKHLNLLNYTILVAEDDDLNFKLLQIALNKTKANVIRAKNGEEVLTTLNTDSNIDIILMDIQMPILDGYTTTRQVKKLYPHIPVIAQTAFAMSEDKEKCFEAGCDDYISKPLDMEELNAKLVLQLEKSQFAKLIKNL